MAKNKRNKIVPISKVTKKETEKKNNMFEKSRNYLEKYKFCYVFKYKNMTTMPMQELRNYFKDDKFLIGKNKVLQVALGKTEDDTFKSNTFKLSKYLKGNCGLFFSNNDPDMVIE